MSRSPVGLTKTCTGLLSANGFRTGTISRPILSAREESHMPGGDRKTKTSAGVLTIMSCSSAPRVGHIDAGATPGDDPAGDDPGGGHRDHADPPRRWPDRCAGGPGDDARLPRPAPHDLRCGADR